MRIEQNETLEMQNDEVADLPVSDEQAEQTKGGVTLNYQKFHIEYLEQDKN